VNHGERASPGGSCSATSSTSDLAELLPLSLRFLPLPRCTSSARSIRAVVQSLPGLIQLADWLQFPPLFSTDNSLSLSLSLLLPYNSLPPSLSLQKWLLLPRCPPSSSSSVSLDFSVAFYTSPRGSNTRCVLPEIKERGRTALCTSPRGCRATDAAVVYSVASVLLYSGPSTRLQLSTSLNRTSN
jgi:hypothetical protein